MKNLISILCLLFTCHCYPSEKPENINRPKMTIQDVSSMLIHTNFTGDEDYLYLNLDLNPQLSFLKNYKSNTYHDGIGCVLKVDCPKESDLFFNNEKIVGYKLEVIVSNHTSNDTIFCDFIHTVKTLSQESSLFYTVTESRKIKNPSIDFNKRAEFVLLSEDYSYGQIVFKNAFPYSQL